MSTLPEDRQGYLGNLETKSVTELQELLHRQEKILNKPRFLQTLPDKGRKVRESAFHLKELIAIKQGKTSKVCQTSHIPAFNNKEHSLGEEISVEGGTHREDDSLSTIQSRFRQDKNRNTADEISHGEDQMKNDEKQYSKVFSDFASLRDRGYPVANAALSDKDYSSASSLKKDTDTLFSCKSSSNKNAETEDNKSQTSTDTSILNYRDPNQEELSQMISDMDLDIESHMGEKFLDQHQGLKQKIMQRSTDVQQCFRPNSYLKIKSVQDLPESYLHKSKHKELGHQTRSPPISMVTHTESAATPPAYKHEASKILSIEESVRLQQIQQGKQSELQAKHAAQRLAERLNVKMDVYTPEGTDMSYRPTLQEEMDSDDEPEVEGYPDD